METDLFHPWCSVQRLVRCKDWPARVPASLIYTLRAREDEQGLQQLPDSEPVPGETVRISHGPFEGYTALLQARTGQERVMLLLDIAQKNCHLEADISIIERMAE